MGKNETTKDAVLILKHKEGGIVLRLGKRECLVQDSRARHLMAGIAMAVILSLLGGCAEFSASRKMDAGPFGENVTVMMGDVTAEVRKPFYIKKYLEGPSRDEYQTEWDNMKKTMRGIVLYSSQVVNIA
jgi:hypothetical protein